MPDDVKTALRKFRASEVAEFSLRQRLEKIEWEETVLKPKLAQEALRIGATDQVPVFSYADED